ncbi:MAG: AAA family ATPase [Syntrophomonas sp.]
MAYLKLLQIHYSGKHYEYTSPVLSNGLNIIEGETNGVGKSTLINLIYYCLGGRVEQFTKDTKGKIAKKHVEIATDEDNSVELYIEINGHKYLLRRFINHNEIFVSYGDTIEQYNVYRQKSDYIFSDWLMEKLGIEVFEIYQARENWKINFTDLMRLIYYDQTSDPRKIFKDLGTENFLSDSIEIRKAVFQTLVGKANSDYYKALGEFKRAEVNKELKRNTLEAFLNAIVDISARTDDLNMGFLLEKRQSMQVRLDKLSRAREALRNVVNTPTKTLSELQELKSQLIDNELKIGDLRRNRATLRNEYVRLEQLRYERIVEVTQLQKIILSHDHLNLFSPDTCPYCLQPVERIEGKCVCGKPISEDDYEQFFYSSEEYLDILKSKQKSVETIDLALNSCTMDIDKLETAIAQLNSGIVKIRNQIRELGSDLSSTYQSTQIKRIDDEILTVRDDLLNIEQQIKLEEKRQVLENDLSKASSELDLKRIALQKLNLDSIQDINNKTKIFSTIYQGFMKDVYSKCRVAAIDDDYLPVINNGEYLEASAIVSQKLMYYLTILKMSLGDKSMPYPRFLMIDTPETLGIDSNNLIRALSKIQDIINAVKEENTNYQIILTTDIGKYPASFKKYVIEQLTVANKLLKSRHNESSDT